MASLHAFAQPDMQHMRGVHATSNYGVNVQGFRKAVFASPATITADSVQVNIALVRATADVIDSRPR
jgi:hypothetical protein